MSLEGCRAARRSRRRVYCFRMSSKRTHPPQAFLGPCIGLPIGQRRRRATHAAVFPTRTSTASVGGADHTVAVDVVRLETGTAAASSDPRRLESTHSLADRVGEHPFRRRPVPTVSHTAHALHAAWPTTRTPPRGESSSMPIGASRSTMVIARTRVELPHDWSAIVAPVFLIVSRR